MSLRKATKKQADSTEMERSMQAVKDELKLIKQRLNSIDNHLNQLPMIENDKYTITTTVYEDKSFFWVCNKTADDLITRMAKEGKVFLDPEVVELFSGIKGTFLDIGANIGAFSLAFATKGWSGYAFEASSANADVFRKSILLNNFNVSLIENVIYDRTDRLFFVQNGPWGFVKNQVFGNEQYEELNAISLDDWFTDKKIGAIDLIKIDIEGSEVAALRGAAKMLKALNYPPIYTEVNAFALALQGETPYSYFKTAEDMGYRIYEIYGGNLYEYDKAIFPIEFCRDYIFLKEIPEFLRERTFGRIANNDGRYENICQRLKNYERWTELNKYGNEESAQDYDSYLLFALKDYPNIMTEEIKEILLEIRNVANDNILVNNFLKWL